MKRFSTESDEEYVKNLLGLINPELFSNLKNIFPKNKSPDLVDYDKSIGVEVTNGIVSTKFSDNPMDKVKSEIFNFKKDYFGPNVSFSQKNNAYKNLSLAAKHWVHLDINPKTKKPFIWSYSLSDPTSLIKSVKLKFKKLNSNNSSYITSLKRIDLFVLGRSACLSIEEMSKVKKNIEDFFISEHEKDKKFIKKFDFIYVLFIDHLFMFAINGELKETTIKEDTLALASKMSEALIDK